MRTWAKCLLACLALQSFRLVSRCAYAHGTLRRTWNDTKGYGFIDLPGQPRLDLVVAISGRVGAGKDMAKIGKVIAGALEKWLWGCCMRLVAFGFTPLRART